LHRSSELTLCARDENYITQDDFNETYELAGRTRAAIRGFINYLKEYNGKQSSDREH
jgi:hypothetical protein